VAARSRAVLCALARDVERDLPDFVARIDSMADRFADFRVIIFENDSLDATPRMLREWAAADSRVHAICETRDDPKWGPTRDRARTEQLAGYRNRCRELALDRYGDFDWMIVADVDLHGWSSRGIAHTLGQEDFDAVGANGLAIRGGRPFFYDTWAFRCHGHPEAHPNLPTNLMVFPTGAPLLRVRSCFGGLAIYRMEAMAAAEYGGEDCEHVVLHRRMAEAGHDRVFLNPSMVVRYPDFLRMFSPAQDRARWWRRPRPKSWMSLGPIARETTKVAGAPSDPLESGGTRKATDPGEVEMPADPWPESAPESELEDLLD
jgi:hypothetical protein